MLSADLIRRARQADLAGYLQGQGVEVRREGDQYRLPGHGGLLISGCAWYQHSTGRGGNAIDFLIKVEGLDFTQAVLALTEVRTLLPSSSPAIPSREAARDLPALSRRRERPSFHPPDRSPNPARVIRYLTQHRRLPPQIVTRALAAGVVYQDTAGNCAFPCFDRAGVVRAVFLRGTSTSRLFKGFATGSDANYPWWWAPLGESTLSVVVVTESPIDALSVIDLRPAFERAHLVALNGVRQKALGKWLSEHSEVRIVLLGLDSDKTGSDGTEAFQGWLKGQGYTTAVMRLPEGCGDWNAALVASCK